ncbi:MAG TPA: hypothetical protein VMS17_13865 [Gemmataceae bacterium]|nr:hypothetical protein [Gemmataceae bacterium]
MPPKEAKPRSAAVQGIPAVTIRQPRAAAALAFTGPFEHLGWQTDYRGPLLIHAARRESGDAPAGGPDGPAYSALLGLVDLVECVCTGRADGGADEMGFVWVFANPRTFADPIPYVGRLGLFNVAPAVVEAALAGLRRASHTSVERPRPKKEG